ncbi:Catechol 2,3-dioxygenase [Amycolatopsis xylanica]|uniref:Catechol 2,3-dioxygenase n=1 Tax=Amycolatopsis xylanica TaxID=589385 RepID=A0A1H3R596_9PSEU|nr:VOC family protein [Amycolatopsis xylanica]SDZ20693.1 Catechol 2,3-dioxygenase [Amycolatopsis xylanica]
MRTGVFLRWVAHPLTIGATAVLLLNDHVFKQAWPGLVTGKLSDVAGLVVAPPVLGLLLGLFLADRIGAAVAVVLTGAGFAVVKLTSAGAEAASAVWSGINGPSVVLADSSDLVALPALGLAWWAWRQAASAPPLPDGLVFRARVVVAVPFAVLAICATSAPASSLPSVDSVRSEDGSGGQVVIEVGGLAYGSRSGVDGWTPLPGRPPSDPRQQRRPQTEPCVPDDAAHCYRVHGGGGFDPAEAVPRGGRMLGVDETTDAGESWHTAWEVPAARWQFVLRQHPFPAGVDRVESVASVEVMVRTVQGGHEVIVANGVEGLAVRGADGAWRRVPVVVPGLEIRPMPLTGFGRAIGVEVSTAGLIAVLALVIGMSVAAGRAGARLGRGFAPVVVPLVLLSLAALPILGAVAFFASTARMSTGLWLVVDVCLFGSLAGFALTRRLLPRSRVAVVIGAAVLTGLASVGPLLGWTVGHPQEHDPAVELGLILAACCLVGVVVTGWWAGRDPGGSRVRERHGALIGEHAGDDARSGGTGMRTLHVGLRVTDLERSLAFYTAVGYEIVGRVPETPIGQLTMLKLPGDEFVTVELVHDGDPVDLGTGVSHFVVRVESMDGTLDALAGHGIEPSAPAHENQDGLKTAFIADPDGRRIELVQWPAGHPDGMTAADFLAEEE